MLICIETFCEGQTTFFVAYNTWTNHCTVDYLASNGDCLEGQTTLVVAYNTWSNHCTVAHLANNGDSL